MCALYEDKLRVTGNLVHHYPRDTARTLLLLLLVHHPLGNIAQTLLSVVRALTLVTSFLPLSKTSDRQLPSDDRLARDNKLD